MAARYARAGGGNWSTDATWSTTSGGAADTVAPTAADDVFLDASSGNVTIDANVVSRSINCTGYTGTLTHNAVCKLTLGDATAGASNIALKFVAGMTYTLGNSSTSAIDFVSSSATVQGVDFAGKTSGSVNYTSNNNNGSWQYTGAHTCGTTTTVALTKGTLDTNGQTCSWGSFSMNNANTKTLTLGSSAITMTGSSTTVWNASATNTTLNANTSTITFTGATVTISLGTGLTYNNIVISGSGTATWNTATTTANFTRTGTAAKTDILSLAANLTCTGTFTCNGNSATNRVLVQSNTVGTARTITAATVSCSNVDFQDITGAGAGSWDLSAITGGSGDCGGNSGITFTTSSTQTWSGTSGGNWSANAWTTRVPLPQDDVSLGVAFDASQTVTADMPRLGRDISFTGATGSPTFTPGSGGVTNYGSLTLVSGVTIGGSSGYTFAGRGTHTLTMAGASFTTGGVNTTAVTGTFTLQDAFSSAGGFTLNTGNWVTQGFNCTSTTLSSNNSSVRSMTLGSTVWTLTSTAAATIINFAVSTNFTFSGASATFVIANATANTRTLSLGALTYGTLTYTVAGSTGKLTITNSNTFDTINFSDVTNARTLELTAGTTQTITGSFNVNGTSGKLMSITSTSGGSAATLSKASGTVSCDYLSIQDSTATGGAAWYAGANSTNVSGNSGWIFTAAPAVFGNITAISEQEALNRLNGSGEKQYTLQEIANTYNGTGQHTLTFQEVLNVQASRDPHAMSEQEALYENLKTPLGLSGGGTKYSVQELLNLAVNSSLALSTVLG